MDNLTKTTPTKTHSILIVETEPLLSDSISLDLKDNGYTTLVAEDTQSAIQQVTQNQPDLLVIDRMLGGESGLKLCQQLRRTGLVAPVLMLMVRDAVEDRVACLESGADDYFLKPYRSDELLGRIRLYLRSEQPAREQLRFDDLTLDLATRRAFRGSQQIELTMKEFELLKYLMEHPREVLTRDQILENVWGYDFLGESNVIEVYIRYLRLKLEDGGGRRVIQTVRGVGYVLRES
ncbi:MAG: response regulator transcription factor [Synechococcales cyanobacterium CRU_2_2]|nr:response regulator transcription factor [Synechococcales cyanobacterium CRU_2_2]